MKKQLLTIIILLCCFNSLAQSVDEILDSTSITFTGRDSLVFHIPHARYFDTTYWAIDTTSDTVWQVGRTLKPVFSNTVMPAIGIMTDTLNPYPKNADHSFIIRTYNLPPNFIFKIWHRYDMDTFHAGGTIEFSTDTGNTWTNVLKCAGTINSYNRTDTIFNGVNAFTGNSNGTKVSTFEFNNCVFAKGTGAECIRYPNYGPVLLRFRFMSDTTMNDTLSGWMIDSMMLLNPGCIGGLVSKVGNQDELTIAPNPATDEVNITATENITHVQITNTIGQVVFDNKCNNKKMTVSTANFSAGIYFVRINDSIVRKLIKQ